MKSNTAYRTKLRAVFLAAIMVISVVGMSVAFTGTVAAASNQPTWDNNNPYQGQTIENTTATAFTDNEELDLRLVNSYTDEGNVASSSSVRDVFADSNGGVEIDTSDLEPGQYFLDGTAVTRSDVEEGDTFEVRLQTFSSTDFDDDVVTDSGQDSVTELDIDSNRGAYTLLVDAEGDLDETELAGIHITVENADGLDAADEAFSADELNTTAGDDITLEKYVELLGAVREGVKFEDNDIEEDLEITASTTLAQAGLSNILIEDADGSVDITVENSTTFGQIATPNTSADYNVNPFNALLLNEDTDDADQTVVMLNIRDTAADVSFNGVDAGDYSFNFNVEDTEASGSADITVREEDVDGAFSQGVYQQTAGDIVEFELELEDTDEIWVQIGDQDAGFVDVVYIKADDEDEPVTFEVNTRALGADGTFSNVYSLGDNVDTLESAIHSTTTSNIGTDQFYNDNTEQSLTFEEYLEALDLIDDAGTEDGFDQLTRPMQPTDYELVAAATGSDGTFIVNDDDESEADDELDSAVLELQAPSLGEITTWVAPADDANEDDSIEDLLESVTQRDDIALDDRLVVQYEASGIFGGMVAASDDDFDILEDGTSADLIAQYDTGNSLEDEGINFLFESEDAVGNQDPTSLDFSNLDDESEAFLILDNEGGQFFLIVDTDADVWASGEPEDGDNFEIELEYETDDDDRARFDDVGQGNNNIALSLDPAGYPYFAADSTQAISAEISFEDAAISFNNLNADGEVQAENIEDSEISGVTNIAPGSSGEIRVASTDASTSFRIGQSVEIADDGTVSATFGFSGQEVGDEFDTRFRISGSNVDTVDSVIVAEGDLGVEEPVEDDDEEPVDDDPEPVDGDDDVADDDDDDEEPVDDETPGFGVLVALLAIIGAALLATRRQN